MLDLHGCVFVVGGYRSGFCEKLPEGSTVSDGANASQLQDGPTTEPISSGVCASVFSNNNVFSKRERGY